MGPLESVGGPVAGKVALVTGATSGIGKATAIELGRRGATGGNVFRDECAVLPRGPS